MQIAITILHIAVCIILILVVLLQAGRGANMGAVFGGSSQTIFGSSGPGTFLGKVTTGVAIVFMITSLSLTYVSLHKDRTTVTKATRPPVPVEQSRPAPVTPPPAPTAPAK